MQLPAFQLPDLSHLFRTNLVDRILNMVFGKGAYTEPTQFQLTTAARLLDKSLTEWDSARSEFAEHAGARDGVPEALQSREPGVTRAFFRAIGHLETVVDSLARLLRLVSGLEKSPGLQEFSHMSLAGESERIAVQQFRNRIAHGDEDIEEGKAGQGLSTATLRPDLGGIELRGRRLHYVDLARMLEEVHDYLRAAAEKSPSDQSS
jgi:hypothetical protein